MSSEKFIYGEEVEQLAGKLLDLIREETSPEAAVSVENLVQEIALEAVVELHGVEPEDYVDSDEDDEEMHEESYDPFNSDE